MSRRTDCYYADPNVCEGDTWQCITCGEHFCQTHWHETELGDNVECVACETSRIVAEKHR